jgi:quinol monooxygenase YgiN
VPTASIPPWQKTATKPALRTVDSRCAITKLVRPRVRFSIDKDTGTLQYALYFNRDNTACLVFKRYRDSQALLDHHKNLGDTMAAILRTCSGSGEICGTPSPELIEQLKDSPVQVYKPFQAIR